MLRPTIPDDGARVGVPSSRRIATRLEDIAFRVLAANNTPDFRTISDFRKDHLGAVGVVSAGGAAVSASGAGEAGPRGVGRSKHKAMSYKRMKEKEAQLQGEVDELLRRAQEVDEEEDRRYGRDRGDELPAELAFREGRLERIREAMAALEAEARAAGEQAAQEGKERSGVPEDKAQRNFTDAAHHARARWPGVPAGLQLPGGGGQWASGDRGGAGHQPGLGQAAGRGNDRGSHRQCGGGAQGGVRRAGYYSAQAVADLQALGADPYVAPEKTRHGYKPPPAPRGRIPKGLSARDRMRRKLQTKRGRQRYALRMATVEPVFGQIKPRVPAVPAAGRGEGAGRVVADLHRPQPAETVPQLSGVGQTHTANSANRVNPDHHMAPSVVTINPQTGC